jgi:hypothetical protein
LLWGSEEKQLGWTSYFERIYIVYIYIYLSIYHISINLYLYIDIYMYIVYTQFSSLWRDDGFAVAAGSTTAAFRGSSAMRRRMPPVKSADFGTEKR